MDYTAFLVAPGEAN